MGVKQSSTFKYFFLGVFILLIFLSFLVIQPFINSILASIVIAYVFYPIFRLLNNKIKNKSLCALIVSVFIILLITIPFSFLLQSSATEAQYLYVRAKQKIVTGEVLDLDCAGKDTLICRFSDYLKVWVEDPEIKFYLQDMLGRFASMAIEKTSSILFQLPGIILQIVITFFILFYLFKEGPDLIKKIKDMFPLKRTHKAMVYHKVKETTHAVMYGSIVIAVIQGALGAIGFWIFGIPTFYIWGMVMAIFALVPFVGTAIIWIPAALYLIAKGSSEGNTVLIWNGVGLLLYGTFIISSADNILKPKLIGDRGGLHPVFVLLGVIGGLQLFGFAGFIIGPLILSALKSFLDIYQKEGVIV
ncbi:AI-2E family transporter [Candidatus Woesearchaeota archaeon]|nr:AI-2E family transporter [Candidatus Woesearchaeota archaeon]